MPISKLDLKNQLEKIPSLGKLPPGNPNESRILHEVLHQGEIVHAVTHGEVDYRMFGDAADLDTLLVITDQRILALKKGLMSFGQLRQKEIQITDVSTVSFEVGLIQGVIKFIAWEKERKLSVPSDQTEELAYLIRRLSNSTPSARTTPADDDAISQLERLANLKREGLLSEAEFQAEKAKILSRS